jgi:hypothetical protein
LRHWVINEGNLLKMHFQYKTACDHPETFSLNTHLLYQQIPVVGFLAVASISMKMWKKTLFKFVVWYLVKHRHNLTFTCSRYFAKLNINQKPLQCEDELK